MSSPVEQAATIQKRVVCRVRGHRFTFHQFDLITISHSLRCSRCGLTGWPNEDVERLVGPWRTAEENQ